MLLFDLQVLFNLGRYWFYKYKFMEKLTQLAGHERAATSRATPKDIVDVEYEVVEPKSKK